MSLRKSLTFCLAISAITLVQAGSLSVADVFGDDMVLQAGRPIVLWGKGEPDSAVTATFGSETVSAKVEANGSWRVTLGLRPPSKDAISLLVRSGTDEITLKNIVIGDVWLCGGQSNMVRELAQTLDGEGEAASANIPELRLIKVAQQIGREPMSTFEGKWTICSPKTAGDFSAVAYYFGKNLTKDAQIPIGLIVSAVGGTPAEAWTPREALVKEAAALPHVKKRLTASEAISVEDAGRIAEEAAKWKTRRDAVEDPAPGLKNGWHESGVPMDGWKPVKLPASWERVKLEAVDGSVWFRRTFTVPSGVSDDGAFLALGVTRNRPRVWLNGKELKGDPSYSGASRTVFQVGEKGLREGENTVAVRLIIAGGKGGIQSSDNLLGLYRGKVGGEPIVSLEGEWMCRIEQALPIEKTPDRSPWEDKTTPGILWNGMIAPLVPVGLRGVIWYQGEANVPRPEEYARLFPLLIRSWREAWGDPALPFLFVQLAGFQKTVTDPVDSTWALLRQAQESGLALDKTAMAVAYDEGDPLDIHPRNKKPVGERLARAAKHLVYDSLPKEEALSPRLVRAVQDGERIRLEFSPPAPLLTKDHAEVRGVAVAGPDRKFSWAPAHLDGSSVFVTAPANTKWIRFAWANFPQANLISKAGLPVAPFEWEIAKSSKETGQNHEQ